MSEHAAKVRRLMEAGDVDAALKLQLDFTDRVVAQANAQLDRAAAVAVAARRLLDNVTPFGSALEVEHHADGEQLYADLAEALGLGRNYRPENW